MRVPLSWLRSYAELPTDPDVIADRLALSGFPVAAIERRPRLSGVVVGRIAALERHPNADRLQIGHIEIGAGDPIVVATAATNVAPGQTIAVALPGATLANARIERRTMRGVVSEGMMCSADELALPPEWFEDGILQLDGAPEPGTDAIAYLGLDEPVFDVEVTGNRPDALSMIGLARELAAAFGVPLRLPPDENPGTDAEPAGTAPEVTIETPDCLRFVAQRFDGIRNGIAPAWMRVRLALAGQRPIDRIVDVTNYVMLETGQPLHAYDADLLASAHLIVRDAREGERLQALDEREYALSPQVMVVADEHEALGVAGVIGGTRSAVGAATTAIVLESATFRGARVRRSAAALGVRTEASTRHEKSLPPALAEIGAARAAQLLAAMGARAYRPRVFGARPAEPEPIRFPLAEIPRLLGFTLSADEAAAPLRALGCAVAVAAPDALAVTPPPWRRDLSIAADLVEEVARVVGYDRIEAAMPAVTPQEIDDHDYRVERDAARTLSALGYREIVTYALHGAQLFERLARAGITPSHEPVEIRNPLSEDQRWLRYALGPSMLAYFARVGRPMRAFEIGHVFHRQKEMVTEAPALLFGFTMEPQDDPPWRDNGFLRMKGDALAFLRALTGRTASAIATTADARTGMHPGKTAALILDGRELALLGRVDPRVADAFVLALPAYLCHVYLDRLPERAEPRYRPPSKYPGTYRDLALLLDLDVPAARVEEAVRAAAGALCTNVRVFDEYRGPQIPANRKSLAVRVTLQRSDATITDAEADAVIAGALERLREELGAELRA